MNQHHYIIGIGSNNNAQVNIARATSELRGCFRGIRISAPVSTRPIGMPNDYMFTNCVAIINSEICQDELKRSLKSIEKSCGRCPEDKARGIIALDLDIIKADDVVLKKEDLNREYNIEGLKSLGEIVS